MRTPSEIGEQVADEIVRLGHFQGVDEENDMDQPEWAPVCVVTAKSFPNGWESEDFKVERNEFLKALDAKVGLHLYPIGFSGNMSSYQVWDWNDRTPTDEVINVLRSL